MRRPVRIGEQAERDMRALSAWLSEQAGRSVARRYVSRLRASFRALQIFPKRGSVRPELGPGVRVIGFERRVSVAFVVEADRVLILGVAYGGRRLIIPPEET